MIDEYFPGTTDVVPFWTTAAEATKFLRLDINNGHYGTETERTTADAIRSLDELVRSGRLTATKIGKCRRYCRVDLCRLLEPKP